ncbi:MAG: RNA polymerase sigma factor [Candidatus Brennerbacteria bacterium]|nr:RNA polymerase sigma factor [Candidatus Brennerbacteria bacterium]
MKNVFNNKPKMDEAVSIDAKTQKAFLKAFDELAPKLYRFCLFKVGSKQTAEDLVSQTFLKTFEYLKNNNEIKTYSVFLYQVLKNLITDHWRGKYRHNISLEEFPDDIFPDPRQSPEKIINKIEFKRVMDGLSQLPQDQQEIIHWRFVDELSIKEIAKLSGKKNGAVYVSIYRGVQRLKKIFDNV